MHRLEGRSEDPRARSGAAAQPGAARPAAAAPTATWLRRWPRLPCSSRSPRASASAHLLLAPRSPRSRRSGRRSGPHSGALTGRSAAPRPARQVPLRSRGARQPERGAGSGGGAWLRVCGRGLVEPRCTVQAAYPIAGRDGLGGGAGGWGRFVSGYCLTCSDGGGAWLRVCGPPPPPL